MCGSDKCLDSIELTTIRYISFWQIVNSTTENIAVPNLFKEQKIAPDYTYPLKKWRHFITQIICLYKRETCTVKNSIQIRALELQSTNWAYS